MGLISRTILIKLFYGKKAAAIELMNFQIHKMFKSIKHSIYFQYLLIKQIKKERPLKAKIEYIKRKKKLKCSVNYVWNDGYEQLVSGYLESRINDSISLQGCDEHIENPEEDEYSRRQSLDDLNKDLKF